MIILIGASASGKTEVVKYLQEKKSYKKLITYTTREIRMGEKNHVDYHFVSRDEFKEMIEKNKFFEFIEYNNNYYGTAKEDITDDKVVILVPSGYKKYHESSFKHIVSFFLDASRENRKKRMELRKDDPKRIEERLKSDETVFDLENISKVDFVIDSDCLDIKQMSEMIDDLYKRKMSEDI